MLKVENSASVVLYNFLISNRFDKPFLLPANICPIVPTVFLKADVAFEFIDIDDSQALNKTEALCKIQTGKYSGICFVHSYGRVFDNNSFYYEMKSIIEDFCIIDDRCLCIPNIGLVEMGYSDLILYSTGYSKYVDLGFGGWGIINNFYNYNKQRLDYNESDLAGIQKIHRSCLENNTMFRLPKTDWLNSESFEHEPNDYFYTVIQALQKINVHKTLLNEIYKTELPAEIQLPDEYNNWRFNILVENRDFLMRNIVAEGLFAGTNYPSVANMFSGCAATIAEGYSRKIMNLFNDFRFDEIRAHKICAIISIQYKKKYYRYKRFKVPR